MWRAPWVCLEPTKILNATLLESFKKPASKRGAAESGVHALQCCSRYCQRLQTVTLTNICENTSCHACASLLVGLPEVLIWYTFCFAAPPHHVCYICQDITGAFVQCFVFVHTQAGVFFLGTEMYIVFTHSTVVFLLFLLPSDWPIRESDAA